MGVGPIGAILLIALGRVNGALGASPIGLEQIAGDCDSSRQSTTKL